MAMSLFSMELLEDPYPAYRVAHSHNPVAYDPTYDAWVLVKHADVDLVLKNPAVFSSQKPVNALPSGLGARLMLLSHDPPEHNLLRSYVQKAFTTPALSKLRAWITEQVDGMLDGFDADVVDFAARLAVPLPIRVMNRILGLPDERWNSLKAWTESAALGQHGSASYPSRKALLHLYTLFRTEFLAPERLVTDGLLAALANTTHQGRRLSAAEIMSFCMTLHLAGNETVASLLGNTLNLLAQTAGLWDCLRADRSLVEPAIEESLRLESPVQFVSRRVLQDVMIGNVSLRPGSTVMLCFGAANRDPEVFENPDCFELHRGVRNHLSLGRGIHYCLGALLTRMQTAIVLNQMLDRYSRVTHAGPGVRLSSMFFRGFKSLPLRLRH